jgi:phosphatidylglycerophosphate synthase
MAALAFALSCGPGRQRLGAPDADSWIRAALLAAAAACIQLRLLCNLLDGMLAVEEGFRSKTGELYNELPDRLADVLILVGAGYAARTLPYGIALGWAAAVLALLTAYVRALGGSLGLPQPFSGPMAKQHRMFTLTVAALASVPAAWVGRPPVLLRAGLIVIVAGALVTVARRTRHLFREVNAQ